MVVRSLVSGWVALYGLSSCGGDPAPVATSAGPPPSATVALPQEKPRVFPPVVIPSSTSWKRGSFPEMKLAYQLPPCLEKATPAMISGARPGVGNESTWGLSAKTAAGLDIVLVELGKDAKHDRASWLKDFKEGATKGEVMVDADDAVVKRSRVMGRKTAADLPYLSDDSIDLRVCKKLGESDYCLELVGTVTLALNKPGVTIDEGTELVAWVRSLERAPVK